MSKPSRRAVMRALAVALTITVILGFYWMLSRMSAGSEKYAVYSAYIDAGLTGESHSLGSRRGLTVILDESSLVAPDSVGGLPFVNPFMLAVSGINRLETDAARTTRYSFLAASLSSKQLNRDFAISSRYVLANRKDLSHYHESEYADRFAGTYGYLMFSGVGFNHDMTQAMFYMEHMCGLCGGGRFVLMQKVQGRWVTVREAWTWIS